MAGHPAGSSVLRGHDPRISEGQISATRGARPGKGSVAVGSNVSYPAVIMAGRGGLRGMQGRVIPNGNRIISLDIINALRYHWE